METLNNQTVYKCSYCGRKKLSKRGCLLHEQKYCKNEKSPHMISIKNMQDNCPHNNLAMAYSYIPGEAVMEPNYKYCLDCGKYPL
jgi:hypothetical protein